MLLGLLLLLSSPSVAAPKAAGPEVLWNFVTFRPDAEEEACLVRALNLLSRSETGRRTLEEAKLPGGTSLSSLKELNRQGIRVRVSEKIDDFAQTHPPLLRILWLAALRVVGKPPHPGLGTDRYDGF